jgi:NADH-quinone oxidoreductase subunit K
MMDQTLLLVFAIILFGVGFYALLGKRNIIKILMGIEIMTIAINVVFIALGTNLTNKTFTEFAQIFPLISIAVGAAVMAIGLALVINNYRHAKSIDSDEMSILKR